MNLKHIILAATFAGINLESCQRVFTSFCATPSAVAVLFDWNLSRMPVLRQVAYLDMLLCTGFNLRLPD